MRLIALLMCLFCSQSFAATINASSCSASDIGTAITAASAGDTVVIPSGTCSWSGSGIYVDKAITVQGAGAASTIINWNGSGEALAIAASDVVVKNFRINATSAPSGIMVYVAEDAFEWRVTGMIFDYNGYSTGYIIQIPFMDNPPAGVTWGVFDNNQFLDQEGERAFFRGPCNSWDTAHSMGAAGNLFFEDNTITAGSTAYWDFNANSRVVIRNNSVENVYFDGHGTWSNSDLCSPDTHRGVRHMEIYNNSWVSGENFRIIYPRGGGGMIWGNRIQNATNKANQMIFLDEYCARTNDRGWCANASCPSAASGPLRDQIGRGIDIASGVPGDGDGEQADEPMLIWDNLYSDNTRILMVPNDDSGFSWAGCTDVGLDQFIVEGRDYCLGTGTQSTVKPTTCNGVSTTYTAYTYPHPLVSGAETIRPEPPTNVVVTQVIH